MNRARRHTGREKAYRFWWHWWLLVFEGCQKEQVVRREDSLGWLIILLYSSKLIDVFERTVRWSRALSDARQQLHRTSSITLSWLVFLLFIIQLLSWSRYKQQQKEQKEHVACWMESWTIKQTLSSIKRRRRRRKVSDEICLEEEEELELRVFYQ